MHLALLFTSTKLDTVMLRLGRNLAVFIVSPMKLRKVRLNCTLSKCVRAGLEATYLLRLQLATQKHSIKDWKSTWKYSLQLNACLSLYHTIFLPVLLPVWRSVFLSTSVFIWMSICLSVGLFVCQYFSFSLFLYVCLHLSVGLSACLSVCRSVRKSLCLSLYLSVGLSLSVSLGVCMPVCLFVCMSVWWSDRLVTQSVLLVGGVWSRGDGKSKVHDK